MELPIIGEIPGTDDRKSKKKPVEEDEDEGEEEEDVSDSPRKFLISS